MNTKDLIRLGVPLGATRRATDFISRFILGGGEKAQLESEIRAVLANPAMFAEDSLAESLPKRSSILPRRLGHNRSATAAGAKGWLEGDPPFLAGSRRDPHIGWA